jgi:hypothetical protein
VEEKMKPLIHGMLLSILSIGYVATFGEKAAATPTEPTVVRGLTVYGMDNEESFPVIIRDSVDQDGKPVKSKRHITIQFDVLAAEPPNLKIRFFHCSRDWKPDQNLFVQDANHNTSFHLDYHTAPNGVVYYAYRYVNHFPDKDDAVRFDYSGNWIFKVLDNNEKTVYGEGCFIVVDNIARTKIDIANEYSTEKESPFNQMNKVNVIVKLPDEIDGYYYTTVDIYQNRRLTHPYRIDANDRDSYTVVEGYNTGTRTFSISNIQPGNEHRVLDITNVTRYPNNALVRRVEGADQQRILWRTGEDRNGTARLNIVSGRNSDYLEVLFRLDLTEKALESATRGGRGIYVVGPFNDWEPEKQDRLESDATEKSMVVRELLRRGIYDYQYVTGIWDETSQHVTDQDWVVLEGNDWRTTNIYYACVYFNDQRFGGFDRIVGYGVGLSNPVVPGSH